MSPTSISFAVNGRSVSLAVPGFRRLLDVLREDLGLTGTKEGCGEGECGACSVIMNGKLVNSCLVPAAQLAGAQVTTIEGLDRSQALQETLHRAFLTAGSAQCGMCTPGMVVASTQLLSQTPHPQEAQVREALAGNLCRCTGYGAIVKAVLEAATKMDSCGDCSDASATFPATKVAP